MVVEADGDDQVFELFGGVNFLLLALEITVVDGEDFDLLTNFLSESGFGGGDVLGADVEMVEDIFEMSKGHVGALEEVE